MKRIQKSDESGDERAVSPVIGVILMVAITVILAAVIAAFVLDLGGDSGASASAGVDVSQDGNEYTAELISVDRIDGDSGSYEIEVFCQAGDDGDGELNSVGSSHTCDDGITVVGTYQGDEAVLASQGDSPAAAANGG